MSPEWSDGHDEASLVMAVRAGDGRAFDVLYRRYRPRLVRFVGNIVRSGAIVEEVVNDALMVLWQRSDNFSGASKLSTWLFAIAYRKAIRARQRRALPLDEIVLRAEPQASPDLILGRERTDAALRAAMSELSPEHRAVVDLTYFHEAGYREIAEIMDCPVATVKTRMFHARRHLRYRLRGDLSDWI